MKRNEAMTLPAVVNLAAERRRRSWERDRKLLAEPCPGGEAPEWQHSFFVGGKRCFCCGLTLEEPLASGRGG